MFAHSQSDVIFKDGDTVTHPSSHWIVGGYVNPNLFGFVDILLGKVVSNPDTKVCSNIPF